MAAQKQYVAIVENYGDDKVTSICSTIEAAIEECNNMLENGDIPEDTEPTIYEIKAVKRLVRSYITKEIYA